MCIRILFSVRLLLVGYETDNVLEMISKSKSCFSHLPQNIGAHMNILFTMKGKILCSLSGPTDPAIMLPTEPKLVSIF